ncbi:relaxase/mobilization nuclease domain-containing protein [Solitalea lacus]|uniref:relaxase/mobilization nuclease domain-containing protein n=1 Tax=Solitalea lacus TaxID=2911172 RepID=UPI001EDBBE59|nr:relaxase/mobilization nuclease domain-containing protein [Solitalea lacus]UKJ07367.1 relaxase/mobilization nuclease domain-containing protein [Solitalea lacus]
MIGKVITGKSFAGCVRYVLQKQDAEILYAEGVRTEQLNQTIDDFNLQRKANPDLGKAVGHIALSWSMNDRLKLNDELMVDVARQYLEKMKILDTQFLIVKHQDRNHPHLHIIYNRVNNAGKTIPDAFQHKRNTTICKDLTKKYGFFIAQDKTHVNRQQLKGEAKVKYELFDTINYASQQVHNLKELKTALEKQDIEMIYKYKSNSNEIQGISFKKDGYTFKGSEIDRSLSYASLVKTLGQVNRQQDLAEQLSQTRLGDTSSLATQEHAIRSDAGVVTSFKETISFGASVFQDLLSNPSQKPEPEMSGKKKKKRRNQTHGYGNGR